jgi:dipeptidyl aminopeptidase/acylaminoacyl peptidase
MFDMTLGNPKIEEERNFMIERSPKTYFDQITAPLLVVQGANDPRITLEESQEIVSELKAKGKPTEILVFDDEGHDVIKFKNKVKCYKRMAEFFEENIRK